MNRKYLPSFLAPLTVLMAQIPATAQTINIDSILHQRMLETHTPGLSALILKKGIPVWEHNYGVARIDEQRKVDDSTIFMLASISKTIVSVAVMKAREQGYLQLDNDISHYLGFSVRNPNAPDDSITLRQLLTHTSSLRDNWNVLNASYVKGDNPIALQTFLTNYFIDGGKYYNAKQNFYSYPPGTKYNYCNMAVTLAAYMVQATTGIPFDTFCIRNIFEPLCMDNAAWHLAGLNINQIAMPYEWENGHYKAQGYYGYPDYADGELRITARSLARFLAMIMNHGSFNQQKILDSSTMAMMFTSQIPALDTTQGIIWYELQIGNRLCWGHNGGDAGVSTNMYFYAPDSTGIILLSNGGNLYSNDAMGYLFDFAKSLQPSTGSDFDCDENREITPEVNSNEMKVFPNPSSDHLTVEFASGEKFSVIILDLLGRIKFQQASAQNDLEIPLQNFENGSYFAEITSGSQHHIFQFIKN